MRLLPFLVLACALDFAGATNTTEHVGFVPEPNCGRGTLGIVWKCFTTIFLCAYTILHFNVPVSPLSRWQACVRNVCWFSIAVFVPELICGIAISERHLSVQLRRILQDKGYPMTSIQQAHFLVSGGLLVTPLQPEDDSTDQPVICLRRSKLIRLIRSPELEKYGFLDIIMDNLPTDEEIQDRSKADVIGKLIAALQALWVAVTLVSRVAQSLDVSLLEVCTIAYIFCALVSYFFWLSKPYGVEINQKVKVQIPHADLKSAWLNTLPLQNPLRSDITEIFDVVNALEKEPSNRSDMPTALCLGTGVVFSAFHCAAWQYSFPTAAEAVMWKVSALFLAFVPIFLFLEGNIPQRLDDILRRRNMLSIYSRFLFGLNWAITGLYACARIFLIVEIFISFRSAPAGIYRSLQWPSYIPHIGS